MSIRNKRTLKVVGFAMWAQLYKPVLDYDEKNSHFKLDFLPENKAEEDKLKANGGKIKHLSKKKGHALVVHTDVPGMENIKTDSTLVFELSRPNAAKDGTLITPPLVVDSQANPVKVNIGNGSLVEVTLTAYDWTFLKDEGTSAQLMNVQILDLVEFNAAKPAPSARGTFVAKPQETEEEDQLQDLSPLE